MKNSVDFHVQNVKNLKTKLQKGEFVSEGYLNTAEELLSDAVADAYYNSPEGRAYRRQQKKA